MTSVTHVLWSGGIGGIEQLVLDLAVAQRTAGSDVAVALGRAGGPLLDRLRDEGVPVHDLGLSQGWSAPPSTIRRGSRLLRERDVVHLHGFNVPLALVARGAGRPIVYTEHGNFGVGRPLGVAGRVKRQAQRLFLRSSVAVLAANSRFTAEQMRDLYGIPVADVRVVHNGVVFGETLTAQAASADGPLRAVVISRLVGSKRVERVIRALALVDPPGAVRTLVIGGGPLEDELRALDHALGTGVEFVGWSDGVRELLREADVLVHPSYAEPFGIVVAEALAEGVLPIAFADGGGVLEVLPDDAVVVHDEGELARVLEALRGSPALSAEARAGRAAWGRHRFSIERAAGEYLALYRLGALRR